MSRSIRTTRTTRAARGGSVVAISTGGIGAALLAAPATPTLTLLSGVTDNTPDFSVTGALVAADTVRFQYSAAADFAVGASDTANTVDAAADAANELDFSSGALADGTWYFRAHIERSGHFTSAWSNVATETIDATAPILSLPTGTKTGATTATLTISTDEGNGTLYAVAVASADSAPSATQIRAGHNAANAAAPYAGNQAVASTGVKTFSATGLSAATGYKAYYAQQDAVGNNSAASTGSATFTTDP